MSRPSLAMPPRIAVILPCFNEALAIAHTVQAFRQALPTATVYVYDNASTDETARVAREAGAQVRAEPRRGKGNVLRRAFADVDADIYVVADGDGTYDASAAEGMARLLQDECLDMVVGTRVHTENEAYRAGHVAGNWLFNQVVASLFDKGLSDIFSGYRVLSRRFIKSFPCASEGFEIEAEMSIHALQLRMPVREVPTRYAKRMEGSHSKLNTWRDGLRILRHILRLQRLLRPRQFFGTIGAVLVVTALLLSIPVFLQFFETGQVLRFPTAILCTGLVLLGALSGLVGLVLEGVSQLSLETKRLSYLAEPALMALEAEDARESVTTGGTARPVLP
ncbi:glycosyltransferase [Corallococcus exiguus]|uniref:Glycosyltransferase n=1 Tax=Corallococcus exiguus TaxID=83462 RepID=A0A7X5BPJ5_9BACT|nr:glycosyltransferase [Corallococcus exiguus]NBC40771.1 glycosyltransferase [Corallococcus exiguus]TNV57796.1 glycosyltransferase [Corallococcus exiguus]